MVCIKRRDVGRRQLFLQAGYFKNLQVYCSEVRLSWPGFPRNRTRTSAAAGRNATMAGRSIDLSGGGTIDEFLPKYPRRESNPDLEFRKPFFYPLNYGGV